MSNSQNLQTTKTDLQGKKKQAHSKVGEGYEQTLFRKRHIRDQQTWKNAHYHWSLEKCKSKPH